MKYMKLIEIFQDGHVVVPIFFLKHYKKLKLSMEEFMFLMYLYNKGNHFLFDPNRFKEDLDLDLSVVMDMIGSLTDKGFLKMEVLKNEKGLMEEVLSLDGFYQKLSMMMMEEVNQEEDQTTQSNVFEMIEKEFGRTLGPIEIEIIKAWLENNMSEELIKEAIKEAVLNGVSNLRYIDKILYEWGKLGIKTVEDVEKMRKKRNVKQDKETGDIDMDIVDWNWFDEDE